MEKFTDEFVISEWEIDTPDGWKDILKIFKTIEYEIFEIQLSDGKQLKCADEHIVINENNEQVFIKDLIVGDNIKVKEGISQVISIKQTGTYEQMYDIEIDSDEHVYYGDNILNHNTTTTAAYILYEIIFNQNPVHAAVLANKGSTANEILSRIKSMFEELPWFLKPGVVEWNKGSIELGNGSKVLAAATSSSSIRGKSISLLMLDELGHIDNDFEFYESTYPVISSGKKTKVIITSTPKGMNLFYKLWSDAIDKRNGFLPLKFLWDAHPSRDETWKNETIKNVSRRTWDQEFECVSGDTIINIDNEFIPITTLYEKLNIINNKNDKI
ncbi:MAG: terminase family protein [Flavobacterium sp.]|uniref:terminase large subunit domain-containing protein n=1 Tax=Flavobacterium sp. TaxID=239 RepID=UPI0026126248|nr:terminase family protein [Flavobacterium sp.]MDD5150605.1 terminase family protein [Flavobacterium sp.]